MKKLKSESRKPLWAILMAAGSLALGLRMAPASASAITWDLSYTGSGIDTHGTLTTTSTTNAQGAYTVTGLDLWRNNVETTTLWPPGTYNDNLLFPGSPIVDQYGIGFVVGKTLYNLYYNYSSECGTLGYREDASADYPYCDPSSPSLDSVTLTRALPSVPEPGPLGLAVTGLAALALARRKPVARG
jgi:hypothetical protein